MSNELVNKNQSAELGKLFEALSKAQACIQNAAKDKVNPHFRNKYADLCSVWNACREALSSNGLSVIQTTEMLDNGECLLVTTLGHSSGEWMKSHTPLINLKKDMQGLGSALTYAKRYALASIVGVASDDDDDANKASEKPKEISAYQLTQLQKLIGRDAKPDEIKSLILSRIGVQRLESIPVARYDKLIEYVNTRYEEQLKAKADKSNYGAMPAKATEVTADEAEEIFTY